MTAQAPVEPDTAGGRRAPDAVADVVIAALLVALFAWGFTEAGEWSARAALFPRLVTGAGFLLGLLLLGQAVLRLRRPAPAPDGDAGPDDADPDDVEHVFRSAGAARWARALGWVAGFYALLYVCGLYLAAAVFSLLYLRFAGRRSWIFSAIYAIVIACVLYAVFRLVLGVPVPAGLLVE
ncbi:MAG TPA: tripartite tricarboxylate transporter TctB family protein [Pseudonocardia sp.]|jgi:hypothetical protein|uniref:tripartite tricarboxylate transporter TctB family protein n=1 Tax=Pseudonocardia sp. TaxID=60912 RepID=UPI002B4ACFDB|nr:tripartite tricarboxylate transporter TctB family protein [Pseudonocardia sp.]HLU59710.1 tripartite tricarboxylate transporter TctB family protein [Pseudonocardia sp.]